MGDVDYYALLGVDPSASIATIRKAYKRLAVRLHPDKNKAPDAADKFDELKKAADILCDEEARKAYDAVRRVKLEKQERERNKTKKQRQMKDDLDAREKAYADQKNAERHAKRQLDAQVARLREEGRKRQKEAMRARKRRATAASTQSKAATAPDHTADAVRVRLSAGGLTEALIRDLFEQFGPIEDVVVARKGTEALLSFSRRQDAAAAVDQGVLDPEDAMSVEWAAGKPSAGSSDAAGGGPGVATAATGVTSTNKRLLAKPPRNDSWDEHIRFEQEVLAHAKNAASGN